LVLFVEGNTWTWLGFATATALAASAFVTGGKRRA
jgi:hypothetical protein